MNKQSFTPRKIISTKIILIIILGLGLSVLSCSKTPKEKLTIAISKAVGTDSYLQYGKWLNEIYPNLEIINLYGMRPDSAKMVLTHADGLVLSGGPDVNPHYYGRTQDSALCEIDNYRDTLEFGLIDEAMKLKLPILGVCRGLQILNIAFGGTLYADIPTYFPSKVVHQSKDKYNCFHNLKIWKSRLFPFFNNTKNFKVNSNHHQGIHDLTEDFLPIAITDDGLIEAFEWSNPNDKPFLIAVQWHPERLSDVNPDLSDSIGSHFLEAAKNYKMKLTKK